MKQKPPNHKQKSLNVHREYTFPTAFVNWQRVRDFEAKTRRGGGAQRGWRAQLAEACGPLLNQVP